MTSFDLKYYQLIDTNIFYIKDTDEFCFKNPYYRFSSYKKDEEYVCNKTFLDALIELLYIYGYYNPAHINGINKNIKNIKNKNDILLFKEIKFFKKYYDEHTCIITIFDKYYLFSSEKVDLFLSRDETHFFKKEIENLYKDYSDKIKYIGD